MKAASSFKPTRRMNVVALVFFAVAILCLAWLILDRATMEWVFHWTAESPATPLKNTTPTPPTDPTASESAGAPEVTTTPSATTTASQHSKKEPLSVSEFVHRVALAMGVIGAVGILMGALWTIASFNVCAAWKVFINDEKIEDVWDYHRDFLVHAIMFGLGLLLIAEVCETIAISAALPLTKIVGMEFFTHLGAVIAVVLVRQFVEYLLNDKQTPKHP
jgi:hypothetical protein